MKCHNVFHISLEELLKPAHCFNEEFPDRVQPEPPPVIVQDKQAYFMVEKILSHHPSSARSCDHMSRRLRRRIPVTTQLNGQAGQCTKPPTNQPQTS